MSVRMSAEEYKKMLGQKNTSKKKRVNKYRNKTIVQDGIRYDSIAEYERHKMLKYLEQIGEISNLRYHQKEDNIILQANPLITYEPDFCYIKDGKNIVEDVKGKQTKEFILKKKMIIAKINAGELNIKFILTKKKNSIFFDTIEQYCS